MAPTDDAFGLRVFCLEFVLFILVLSFMFPLFFIRVYSHFFIYLKVFCGQHLPSRQTRLHTMFQTFFKLSYRGTIYTHLKQHVPLLGCAGKKTNTSKRHYWVGMVSQFLYDYSSMIVGEVAREKCTCFDRDQLVDYKPARATLVSLLCSACKICMQFAFGT